MQKVIEDEGAREAGEELLLLDEIARTGARRMLIAALRSEAYVARHREERDERGHALVVHNGQAQARKLTLGAGTVELRAPRVDDRRRVCGQAVMAGVRVAAPDSSIPTAAGRGYPSAFVS